MTKAQPWPIQAANAYGGVLINAQGQVLLREPSNHFDGYVWTFAKGTPDCGEQPETTALREVHEETGLQAKIIGVLPGVFQSGHSSTAFYLMRPDEAHRPDRFSWETNQIGWFSFSHAKAQVALSTNKLGRQRDLAILQAAENWFVNCQPLALLATFPASKNQWQTQPLPAARSRIELNITYSRMQATSIMLGLVPSEMEDKWFSYFENNVLYQHRSWTGHCIDEIHFVELADGQFEAVYALVNRDPEQYGNTDDHEDQARISAMLNELMTKLRCNV
jgi:8-oxo-dGTP diphosphatase